MALRTLYTRISSLWSGDDHRVESDASAHTEENRSSENETLSYAERVEYGVDERELSDESIVLRMLVRQDGRVDQETVIEETGWSESHLESVVEEMEDDGQISAITVGRRRVICRRGFEPKGYRSHIHENR